jgi:hypothetical protein
MHLFLKILLGFCVVLVLAVGGLLWRLEQGTLSLSFMQPILQYLVDRNSPYTIMFTDPTLVWLRTEDAVGVEVRNVEARTRDDELVAAAPLVRATVAVTPLLFEQRLQPVEVELELPEIQLTRGEDRKLTLQFDQRLAAVPLGATAGGGGLGTLLGESGEIEDPRLDDLRLVRVTAPSLQFVDAVTGDRARAAHAVFELEKTGAIWRASLGGELGDGMVAVIGEPTSTPARPDVRLELQGLRPKDFVAFAPELPLAGLDLPVSGTVRFTVDGTTATIGNAAVDLSMGAGAIAVTSLGLAPIAIKQGELRGTIQAGLAGADIARLQLAADGFSLGASGKVTVIDGEVSANITADAQELDVSEVLQLWPTAVAGDARAWIEANIPAGQLSAVTFQVDQRATRPDQPMLGGTFSFTGAQVRYLDTFPPAIGIVGKASIAGNSLAVKLTAGRTGEVDLTQGTITFSNLMGAATTQLKVNAALRSTVPAAMRLLDAELVALGKSTGLQAERASGNQTTNFELSLPLLDEIPPARIRYKATSQLTDLDLREAIPRYSMSAQVLDVVAEPASISAMGEVRLNGVPLTLQFRESTPPVKGVSRTIKIAGRLDSAGARALHFGWPDEIGGAVGVDATVVEGRDPLRTVALALDLHGASVEFPELVISKRPGEPGKASARLVQANEKSLAIEGGRAELAGWQAEADVDLRLDPVAPERVALRQLRGPLGDLTAELILDGAGWRGRVDVGRLDLRPVLQGTGGAAGGDGGTIPDFLVQVTARQLRLGDAPFSNLAGSVERRRGIWQSAKVTASIEDSQVSLDVDTPTRQTAAILRGSDAGWLIRGFAAMDNGIRGGTFRLSADLDQNSAGVSGTGDLKIRNFTLWGAPTIARIISLASFSGLANALSGQGVPVTRLIVPFRLQGDVLTVEEARLVGSDIGARAEGTIDLGRSQIDISGTVAPAYTVNRIIGRIPIIGQIMSGSRSDAALAATFSVRGTIGQPQIVVNPLAALVPGMVRDLFGAFTADSAASGRIDER